MMQKDEKEYLIVTPAYNEEKFIGKTINSVIRQTLQPCRWIIVDDGSTDRTAEIVQGYAKNNSFIEYHRRNRTEGMSYYGSNVHAILEGYEKIRHISHEYIGILDADIELCCNYYEQIFNRFEMNPELGVAAGTYFEKIDGIYKEAIIDRRSTPKAIQVFRKCCYDQIGGFIPCVNGGEDSYAEIVSRMNGWQTWSFPDIRSIHHKPVGTGDGRSILSGRYRLGLTDYCLATHPLFMMAKCLRRSVIEKPYIASGIYRFAGYISGYIKREERYVKGHVMKYIRKEQLMRLMNLLKISSKQWTPILEESF